jgi:hypothetical protein
VMLWSIVAIFLDLFSKPLSRIVFSTILILLKYFEVCVSYFSLYGLVSLSSTIQNNFLSLLSIFITFLAVIILIIKEDIFENHSYYFKKSSY